MRQSVEDTGLSREGSVLLGRIGDTRLRFRQEQIYFYNEIGSDLHLRLCEASAKAENNKLDLNGQVQAKIKSAIFGLLM